MDRVNRRTQGHRKASVVSGSAKATAKRYIAFYLLASTMLTHSGMLSSSAWAGEYVRAQPNYAILNAKAEHEKGYLGIRGTFVQKVAPDGAYFEVLKVEELLPGNFLMRAGLDVGDEIAAVNGYYFDTGRKLIDFINTGDPGAMVNVTYADVSAGDTRIVTVPLVKSPIGAIAASVPPQGSSVAHEDVDSNSSPSYSSAYSWKAPPSDDSFWWKAAIGLGVGAVVVGCTMLGCFDGDDEGAADGDSDGGSYYDLVPSGNDTGSDSQEDGWKNVKPIDPFYGVACEEAGSC